MNVLDFNKNIQKHFSQIEGGLQKAIKDTHPKKITRKDGRVQIYHVKNKNENGNSDKKGVEQSFENSKRNEPIKNISKRLSQSEEVGRGLGGSRNVAATQILAEYEYSNFSKQEEILTDWAKKNNCWLDYSDIKREFGEVFDDGIGTEAEVRRYDNHHVLKVNNYRAYSKTPLDFLDNRISLHNYLFPETAYELIGFCKNNYSGFSFVVKQPFIEGNEPNGKRIYEEMINRGFSYDFDSDYYYNKDYEIWDLHSGNWREKDGKLYCIDPIINLNSKNRTYNNI